MSNTFLLRLTPSEASRVQAFVDKLTRSTGERLPINTLLRRCVRLGVTKYADEIAVAPVSPVTRMKQLGVAPTAKSGSREGNEAMGGKRAL